MFKAHGAEPSNSKVSWTPDRYAGNLVLRGNGLYTDWNGRTHKLSPGCFFQRIPGKPHLTWYDPASDYAEFFICIDRETATALLKLDLLQPVPVINAGIDKLICEQAIRLMDRIEWPENKLRGSELLMNTLHFIHDLYERGSHRKRADYWSRIVTDACAALEHDLASRQQLEQFAEEQRVAYPTFRMNFKRIIGLSPGEYRIRLRLNRACSLLMENSVKKVAAELGYSNPFTFSTQFSAFVGMSPRQYQKSAMKETEPAINARRSLNGVLKDNR